jgi:hypothetical protein
MSTRGARGVKAVALNPDCQLQSAIVVADISEPEAYRKIAGEDCAGDYGESPVAFRRGNQFEKNFSKRMLRSSKAREGSIILTLKR